MTHPELEELIDLYVISALPIDEGREVAAHLEGCAGCRALAERAREVVQLLRLSVDQIDPPPALRSRLLRQVRERKPTAGVEHPVVAAPPRWRVFFSWLYPAQPLPVAAALTVVPLLLSAWLALQVVQLRSEVRSSETALATSWDTSQAAAEIMARAMEHGGATASLLGTRMAPDASGMLYYAPSEGDAVLVVRGLPELSPGHVYQCWLMSGERRMNGGTFYREKDGRALLVVKSPMPLDAVEAVGVTEEPHGGSTEPRGERYVWGRVKRS